MDESGRGKNPSERHTYLLKHARTDKAGCGKDPSGQGRGLESTDGWTSQDTERIQVSEGHSQLVQCMPQICFDLAWCRPIEIRTQKGSRQGALTFANTDGQVRTWKESEKVRGTYELESADKRGQSGHRKKWSESENNGVKREAHEAEQHHVTGHD